MEGKGCKYFLIFFCLFLFLFPSSSHAEFIIYDDILANGWNNWSWDCTVDLKSKQIVKEGTSSISVKLTNAWSGLGIGRRGPITTLGYQFLEFYINGGEKGGQDLRISLLDYTQRELPRPGGIKLNDSKFFEGGTIDKKQWKLVRIPLSILKADNKKITKINLMDNSGRPQSEFYVDFIVLKEYGNESAETMSQSRITDEAHTIWEIGIQDNNYKEFNQLQRGESFPWHFEAGKHYSLFPREINDGERTTIRIHYYLSEIQASNDLRLEIYSAGGRGGTFSVRIKTETDDGFKNIKGEFLFRAGDENQPKSHLINIPRKYIRSGGNTLVLENATPPWSGHWLFWDYLLLRAAMPIQTPAQAPQIRITEILPDRHIVGRVIELNEVDFGQYKVIIYVKTDKWYIHPFIGNEEGRSYASIRGGGIWNIRTVRREFPGSKVAALLVRRNYNAPNYVFSLEEISYLAKDIQPGEGRL